MTTYTFDRDEFPGVTLLEFERDWTDLKLTDLDDDEMQIVTNFMAFLPESLNEEFSETVLVAFSQDGVLERLYGPAIFRASEDDDSLVLRMGGNLYPVEQLEGNKFAIKQKGKISLDGELISGEAKTAKIKIDGEETEVEFNPTSISFLPSEGDTDYQISCILDLQAQPTSGAIRRALKKGDSLGQFLVTPPSGNGGAMPMTEIEVGEYNVLEIEETETQYGTSYILTLENGDRVWSAGSAVNSSKALIKGGWQHSDKTPVCLELTAFNKGKNGKLYPRCALRRRKAREAVAA